MDIGKLEGILYFLKNSEQLKDTTRSSYASKGRHESTAEHSWRLCLMAIVLEKEFQGIDIEKLLKLCIVHDIGEALNGDIPAVDQADDVNKGVQERKDLMELARPLSSELQKQILSLSLIVIFNLIPCVLKEKDCPVHQEQNDQFEQTPFVDKNLLH